ncbi:hypothetical protein NPIL_97161 [Nephila pilipes]|uniref:Uncharacterized protein n=1 Tax=Nephila pilipes TaxID=299642 RepID=A0A8X6NKD6_NEPPI|nr:hypothetical protein NPIL_97161 [Nephila pilipes]
MPNIPISITTTTPITNQRKLCCALHTEFLSRQPGLCKLAELKMKNSENRILLTCTTINIICGISWKRQWGTQMRWLRANTKFHWVPTAHRSTRWKQE